VVSQKGPPSLARRSTSLDAGYVTVTPDLRFEVSRRIREEFDSGKHYYALDGNKIELPADIGQCPDPDALRWHNENCFRR
jgi:putative restriction endonuclease